MKRRTCVARRRKKVAKRHDDPLEFIRQLQRLDREGIPILPEHPPTH